MLKRLKLSDYCCHRRLEVEFRPGINCVVGSNGKGKTSLINAIYAVLTGVHTHPDGAQGVIRQGAEQATIEADFVASNIYLKSQNKAMYQSMIAASGLTESEIVERMKLRPELLRSFFGAIRENYGSVENFLEKELGVGAKEQAILIQKFTK